MGGAALSRLFTGGSAIIGGYMAGNAGRNISNSMQNQSTPPAGSSQTTSEGNQHEAAGRGANSTSPQTPPGPPCKGCGPEGKKKLNQKEQKVIDKAQAIKNSPEFNELKGYAENGGPNSYSVNVNGTTIQYEPNLPASGMTMFGDNGFILGPEAFTSEAELDKTLLQENYRHAFSQVPEAGASSGLVSQETNAAFQFAERNYQLLK